MKKNKNTTLLIVLVVLVGVFVATKVFRSPARESNLNISGFAIDTALIRSVAFARADKPEIRLEKSDNAWMVFEGEKSARADPNAVDNLMRTLSQTRPERIVSRSEDKWSTYEVADSSAIHLIAYDQDKEPVVDWHIGKQSMGVTYIRPGDGNEVYAMEGSLRSRADNDFNDWRDKTFVRIEPSSVTQLIFAYPLDSGFVVQKSGATWNLDGRPADSAKVEQYLMKLQSRKLYDFAEESVPAQEADVTLTVTAGGNDTVIKAWKEEDDYWTLHSTFQSGAYFRDARVDDDLFVGRKAFTPDASR